MTPQHVISQLLESDTKYPKNLDLLRKIIITVYLGRFRVNGLPPDNKISLGNYLFDEERIIFDFSRLSDEKRDEFNNWLLGPHQKEKKNAYLTSVYVNEYRGFTAEVSLNWWGRLKSWFKNRYAEHWQITDLGLNLNYQLTGIEMCHGQNGILIGFNQYLVPPSGNKYRNSTDSQKDPLGNTKRVFITDRLVEQLAQLNLHSLKFETVCKSPHPYAIEVNDLEKRHKEMLNYREMQKFIDLQPWYMRIFTWAFSCFNQSPKEVKSEITDNKFTLLYESETIKILQRSRSKEIMVREKKPDIKNLVLCGGGAKIFAHIGVWKALNDAGIIPTKFAGSSAGAIMSFLCYLGYSAKEVSDLFKNFKQENLVLFDINMEGLSDSRSLKTALDYALSNRLMQIITKYKIPYPQGKISFAMLEKIRQECPGCGLGEELIVTATNKKLRKTRYFSLSKSPHFEVTEAITFSALYPVVFKNKKIDGQEHNDGGILSNFPTEAFCDDGISTLLESEWGNNLGVLAVQFDNGTERNTIDNVMERVYRENFFLNWIYSLLTGVSDPASGWEQDRLKLRKYAAQSIVISADVSASGFSVDEKTQVELINNGYEATKSYLDIRYSKKDDRITNNELMYSTFSSLGDLLAYCCYRNNVTWFEIVNSLIAQSSLPNKATLMKQSLDLRKLYFNGSDKNAAVSVVNINSVTFFGNTVPQQPISKHTISKHKELIILYPTFLKLTSALLRSSSDRDILQIARHSLTIESPFSCLEHFAKINNSHHVVLHIIINLIKELKISTEALDAGCEFMSATLDKLHNAFKSLQFLLDKTELLANKELFGNWHLTCDQSLRILKLLSNNQIDTVKTLLRSLGRKAEPLQTFKSGVFCEEPKDNMDDLESYTLSFKSK